MRNRLDLLAYLIHSALIEMSVFSVFSKAVNINKNKCSFKSDNI